ncbi:MAG: flavodoxin domain-containing protein, partial [Mediterranea sp.]|nr:flavodoxin domain-containing protein [Mediterranea sp.]
MSEIGIFYGSFTGTTEDVARRIATKVGVPEEEVREVSQLTDELVSDYNVLIFGTATWGSGEAHDDWYDGLG